MAEVVLDASAVLALLHGEPGAALVAGVVHDALISAVNLGEVVGELAEAGVPEAGIRAAVAGLGVRVVPLDEAQAMDVGLLRVATRPAGLSLGDRACLALARRAGAEAWTADAAWGQLSLGVTVRLIR